MNRVPAHLAPICVLLFLVASCAAAQPAGLEKPVAVQTEEVLIRPGVGNGRIIGVDGDDDRIAVRLQGVVGHR